MRSVKYGCSRTRSISPGVSGPRLSQIAFDTPSRPRSWTSPGSAQRPLVRSRAVPAPGRPHRRGPRPRASGRSCTGTSGRRSRRPRRVPRRARRRRAATSRAGSTAITASQLLTDSSSSNRSGATSQKSSTSVGSNWVPLRALATATAASMPPIRVEDLDDVGEVHQPGGHQDLRTAGPVRLALAVPPLERLRHAVADALVEAEPTGQRLGRAPVVVEHRVHGAAATHRGR